MRADVVFSGGGTLLPCHGGAFFTLVRHGVEAVRVAGTSAGAIAAAAVAFGVDEKRCLDLSLTMLGGGVDLLDFDLGSIATRFGAHRGDRVRDLIRATLPGRLGDARLPLSIVAYDVEAQRPVMFTSKANPELPVADVVMASCSIPFVFGARRIPGAKGLYVDGGISVNLAMATFDDSDVPTIGIRFKAPVSTIASYDVAAPRVSVRNHVDFTMRTVAAVLNNANHTHVSSKRYAHLVDIESNGSAFDFSISEVEVRARWNDGVNAAERFFAA